MAEPANEAREIERLTDAIVELLPGQRELSERVARAVWEFSCAAERRGRAIGQANAMHNYARSLPAAIRQQRAAELREAAEAIHTETEAVEVALGGVDHVRWWLNNRADQIEEKS